MWAGSGGKGELDLSSCELDAHVMCREHSVLVRWLDGQHVLCATIDSGQRERSDVCTNVDHNRAVGELWGQPVLIESVHALHDVVIKGARANHELACIARGDRAVHPLILAGVPQVRVSVAKTPAT